MSLDIIFTRKKKIFCQHCGELAGHTVVDSAASGGRDWYTFLESVGYYVPYEQRTEENDWYGKDMVLNEKQAEQALLFADKVKVFNRNEIVGLIAVALYEKDDIVVNADW
jgi:hypothetical protein